MGPVGGKGLALCGGLSIASTLLAVVLLVSVPESW